MSLLDILDGIVPRWMTEAPRVAFGKLMAAPAMLLDAMDEFTDQGRLAAAPGYILDGAPGAFDSVDALPLIARDRLVYPGLSEMPEHLAARLRRYEDDWAVAGTPFGLLDALAGVMQPVVPLMRLVTSGGMWYTRESDGTRRLMTPTGQGYARALDGTVTPDATLAHPWPWDGASLPVPPDQNDASRAFLIIYPPASSPYLTADDGTAMDDGEANDLWNDPDTALADDDLNPMAGTCGSNAPWAFVELVRGVIQQRGCAGFRLAWIVIAFDTLSFAPDGSSSGDLQAFSFSNIANTTITGGGAVVTKSGGAAAYDAFAISTTGITGLEGLGSFDYTITALPAVVMTVGAAWSVTPAVADTWFGFTVYADGRLEVYESGIVRTLVGGAGYLSAGALLRISVNPNGTPSTYWVNHGAGWVMVYTSPTGPVFTLKAFVSMWTVGDTVTCAMRKAAYPAGTWAWHTRFDPVVGTQVPARLTTAEYWPGNPGGALPYTG